MFSHLNRSVQQSAFALLALCTFNFQSKAQSNPLPKPRHRFTVIAHRGDHVKFPENTLEAYAEAIKNGVDYVEIDLRTTRDSALVSMHDGAVDRVTNGKGQIKDLTLAEIKQLEVKSRDSLDKKTYHIPTFEEILKLCKSRIYIYIDFKNASAFAVYQMLLKFGMEKQVIVYINSEEQLKQWRKAAPAMPLMLSLPGNVKTAEKLEEFLSNAKPDLLDGDWKDYTPEVVKMVHEHHLQIWPDVQSHDEDEHWDSALSLGFDGLQTDHPAALIKHLKEKEVR
ncbi:glycerophosphodiester phosphodiesterase family protein [Mucilaginibacter sp. RS28]|uniref:Glycerophosphodiester phosphodiesterase family protein n=1 Tax=Mucilaginibacter straminoryzae TaxID=2932774 RepID=A0A9X2BB91_9SPHI|nr:glycerophosphodiester phosphodiesterase family protein [Mucilaginibacter straminoryzae]MCJ8209597.1 glycerophosphodiester phosphodiesterase family protein [Mucilaginibacter straminoryzae]